MGGIIVEYEVCLTGVSSTDVTLEVEELAIQGLEFGEGNEFENGAATITGLAPDECRTVALVLDASGSILGSGSQFAISVSPSGTQNTCIQGNLMADIVLENCIPPPPAFACPCTGANVRNIEAGAGTNLSALYGTGQGRLPVGTLSNTCLAVNGRLLINQDYTIEGSNIWMQPGASIAVENGAELTLNGNEIRGCEQMWRGISVEPGGHLIFEGNQIEDAQFAITARRGANMPIVDINNNIFNRNHVGIRIPPLFGPLPLAVGHDIQQNTFRCAGCIATDGQPGPTPLLPTFDPIAEWEAVSFAAITVDNYAADFNIGGGNLLPSGFSIEVERLRNGFILTSANVNVFNTRMYDLVGGDPEAIILTPGDRGIGIRAEQCPTVEVRSSHFEKAFNGIYSRRSNFDVRNTNFVDTHIGLLGWEGTNRFLTVNNCRFENYRFSGVNLAGYASPRRVEIIGSTFTSNTASWADVNAFGRAIQVSNGIFDSDASTANKRIEQNVFQLDSRSHGIYLIQAAHYQVLNNTIEYTGAMPAANGSAYGIALLGGGKHYVAEKNDISAADIVAGVEIRGIQLTGSTDNVICCNILDNTTVGVHVLGTCSSTHLRHTDINNHEFGLFCADGSLLGVQTNAGNQWLGMYGEESAAHLGDDDQVASSRFFVELVDPFLPDNPAPFSPNAPDDWFRDFDGEAPLCADDDNCAPPWEVEEEAPDETDIHAATGIYDGTDHGGYLNWESQRHLYAKLKANGSLLGHSPEIDAFYSWASGN
ncbi:MAG: right-handed parallel beta-helix repeat-containing protein, partial [Phaeodactylibacter sp.]|nr:right-handed parallel beta-helix repeat-containing protein [Phaeodactylibacter sp.]